VRQQPIEDGRPQIETGKPRPLIDGLSHYFLSLPTKLLLFNTRVIDHRFPEESELALQRYLEINELRSVKIRHNQYVPFRELHRLHRNKEVGAGYRYTLGLVTWLKYTLLPDRLLAGVPFIGGGDHFNPFTNTINVYSSDVAVLLHEAGHAKDYVQHEMRGTTFALARLIPGIDLMQEARASTDAIRFLQCVREPQQELRAYSTLIPAYSTYIAGYFEGGLVVTLPLVFTGHVTGRVQSRRREQAMTREAEIPRAFPRRTDFLPDYCQPLRSTEHQH
jgi:hypothetical protein